MREKYTLLVFFFFSFDHEARMYISWHFMFKHRSESRETRSRRSADPPFSRERRVLPRNRATQIGFLNVLFRGMDGWIIAFNEFALASKSRAALCSPSQRAPAVDNEWLHLQKFLLLVLRDAITESWDHQVETTGPIVGAFARMYNRQTSVKSGP